MAFSPHKKYMHPAIMVSKLNLLTAKQHLADWRQDQSSWNRMTFRKCFVSVKTCSLPKCMADSSSSSPCPLKMFVFALFYLFSWSPLQKTVQGLVLIIALLSLSKRCFSNVLPCLIFEALLHFKQWGFNPHVARRTFENLGIIWQVSISGFSLYISGKERWNIWTIKSYDLWAHKV